MLKSYRQVILNQRKTLEKALERTNEQITVSYSTFDTAVNSANLVKLINQTQNSFNEILNLQAPEIIPFENTEIEVKFQEISERIFSEKIL